MDETCIFLEGKGNPYYYWLTLYIMQLCNYALSVSNIADIIQVKNFYIFCVYLLLNFLLVVKGCIAMV